MTEVSACLCRGPLGVKSTEVETERCLDGFSLTVSEFIDVERDNLCSKQRGFPRQEFVLHAPYPVEGTLLLVLHLAVIICENE